jgi:hypothetical protein
MKSKEQADVEAARKLPKRERDAASRAWGQLQDEFTAAVLRLPERRRPKAFEVHHATTKARAAFLAELVAGRRLDACKAAARAAFPYLQPYKGD